MYLNGAGETDKETNGLQARQIMARDLETCPMYQNVKRSKNEIKAR